MGDWKAPPPPSSCDKGYSFEDGMRMARTSAYSAGRFNTDLSGWGNRSFSPFQELSGDLPLLVSRAQSGYRNNHWLSRAIDIKVTQEIGTGIVPHPATGDAAVDSSLSELWLDFVDYSDYANISNVYGLQHGLSFGRHLSGDGFAIRHLLKPSRATHLPLALQYQLVDASFCPYDYNLESMTNGHQIIHGVEINGSGQVVAYHFYKQDPELNGNTGFDNLARIPAERVIHHFLPKRAGQLRAVPEIIKAIPKAVSFENYNDSELERKTVRAALTGTVEKDQITEEDWQYDPISGSPLDYDHGQLPQAKIQRGLFLNMLAGEKVNLFQTDDAGRGYHDYQKWQVLALGAATNTPYQLLSGDFEGINDRLWRAIFNDMKRHTQSIQHPFIIPQIARRIWVDFVDRAIATNKVAIPEGMSTFAKYRCNHQPQEWEYIHPKQDVESKILQYQHGFLTRSSIVLAANRERSVSDMDKQRAVDLKSEKDNGLPSTADMSKSKGKGSEKEPETKPKTKPKGD